MAYLAQRDVPGPTPMSDDFLLRLAVALKATGNSFTTVTPATHARVNSRLKNAWARTATEVFGWSRPFREGILTPQLLDAMRNAGVLDPHGEGWVSRVRASTLRGQLFLHSAYADADRIAAVLLTARNATA